MDSSAVRQEAATQRTVLGPGQFELFSAGVLRLSDLVDEYDDPVWEPQVREVHMSVLRNKRRRAA
jgi:hypothetical protein